MASGARNIVIAGGKKGDNIHISSFGSDPHIRIGSYNVSKFGIKSYEVISESIIKSGSSALLRGIVGVAALGGIGALAALTAKDKRVYLIAIDWKYDEKSLIEVDEKIYQLFLETMF